MADFNRRFGSSRQDWATPNSIFAPIHAEFNFTLDAAADASNTKTKAFFCAADDGLQQDWGCHRVWLNPPYGARTSRLSDWVRKALDASRQGATVVVLIPARTNTNWFHELCLKHGEVRFIQGRPKFGDADHGLPQPLCLVIFRSGQRRQARSNTTMVSFQCQ